MIVILRIKGSVFWIVTIIILAVVTTIEAKIFLKFGQIEYSVFTNSCVVNVLQIGVLTKTINFVDTA